MYLAMNRFTVPLENAAEFEELWLSRESRLQDMDGFVSFHMLKGPEEDGRVLYASHTVWDSKKSSAPGPPARNSARSHARAGQSRKLHEGVPRFGRFPVDSGNRRVATGVTPTVTRTAPIFRSFDETKARAFYIDWLGLHGKASTALTPARRFTPSCGLVSFTCT